MTLRAKTASVRHNLMVVDQQLKLLKHGSPKGILSLLEKFYTNDDTSLAHLEELFSEGEEDDETLVPQMIKVEVVQREEFILPPMDRKRHTSGYTLVLDLDETLVHFEAAERKFRLRPGCLNFLRCMAHPYEVVVFTAAS